MSCSRRVCPNARRALGGLARVFAATEFRYERDDRFADVRITDRHECAIESDALFGRRQARARAGRGRTFPLGLIAALFRSAKEMDGRHTECLSQCKEMRCADPFCSPFERSDVVDADSEPLRKLFM